MYHRLLLETVHNPMEVLLKYTAGLLLEAMHKPYSIYHGLLLEAVHRSILLGY